MIALPVRKSLAWKKIILGFILFVVGSIYSQNKFDNQPWLQNYPIIIDPYEGNAIDFVKLKSNPQVVGLLHRASIGMRADKKYLERSDLSKQNELHYASYHLGRKGNPIGQADFYLDVIKNNLNEPMALDIEEIGGNNISLSDAELFIKRIHEKTGKYPMLYINNAVFNAINAKYGRDSEFAKCRLWYTRFLKKLPALSTKVWDKVTIWQFACEINCNPCITKDANGDCIKRANKYDPNCPYKVEGTDFDMDVNVFNGTVEEANAFWNKQ